MGILRAIKDFLEAWIIVQFIVVSITGGGVIMAYALMDRCVPPHVSRFLMVACTVVSFVFTLLAYLAGKVIP